MISLVSHPIIFLLRCGLCCMLYPFEFVIWNLMNAIFWRRRKTINLKKHGECEKSSAIKLFPYIFSPLPSHGHTVKWHSHVHSIHKRKYVVDGIAAAIHAKVPTTNRLLSMLKCQIYEWSHSMVLLC